MAGHSTLMPNAEQMTFLRSTLTAVYSSISIRKNKEGGTVVLHPRLYRQCSLSPYALRVIEILTPLPTALVDQVKRGLSTLPVLLAVKVRLHRVEFEHQNLFCLWRDANLVDHVFLVGTPHYLRQESVCSLDRRARLGDVWLG